MTLLKEKMEEAFNKKANNVDNFVWKGRKVKKGGDFIQTEVKMVDCSIDELKEFLKHCESMLYNESKDNPGRYVLLDIIAEQRVKCNVELFLRWLKEEKEMPRYAFLASLREVLDNNPHVDPKNVTIGAIVGECPVEYQNLPVNLVIDGCLDMLGKFVKSHLTLSFFIKQGLWFTNEETKMMTKEGITDKLEYAKKYLDIPNVDSLYTKSNGVSVLDTLRISSKGLSLSQMNAMIVLRSKKYSELTTLQLETLRNRILFSLENEVKFHITQWKERIRQIKLVLQSKGVTVE